MLGLFARRPRPDAEALARRKRWIADIMSHGDKDHVAVAELVCQVPGCPDLETAVTVTPADRRRFVLRIPPAVGTVT